MLPSAPIRKTIAHATHLIIIAFHAQRLPFRTQIFALQTNRICPLQDVAIAYGYNNVGLSVPATITVGRELPLNQLVELLRVECAMCGFTEILTWALCSRAENFSHLRRQDDSKTAVSIGNPATAEFEVCRTSLLQGENGGSTSCQALIM